MAAMSVIPWGNCPIIEWDEEIETHVVAHKIRPAEIDQVIEQGEYEARPHPKKRKALKYERRYLLNGTTLGGRRLLIVIDHIEGNRIRPVTALSDD